MQQRIAVVLFTVQIFVFSGGFSIIAQQDAVIGLPSIAEKTGNMEKYEGLIVWSKNVLHQCCLIKL